ncbi:methyltransferase domain-containing protein [Salana multivorans]
MSTTRYTHGHSDAVLRSHAWRTVENSAEYLIDDLAPGLDVLDVGCGPGTITVDLARRVSPGGRAVGIDTSYEVLMKASELAAVSGIDNVIFEPADVMALPFASNSFDIVHAHQVLQHLQDPVGALREMVRVLRSGGVLAVRDADYGAMAWFPELAGLEEWRQLYDRVARASGGQPDAGRRLLAWVLAAGFEAGDVDVTASTWCFADRDSREWWASTWADRVRSSGVAERALALGLATREELDELAEVWIEWGAQDSALFLVPHTEVRARK